MRAFILGISLAALVLAACSDGDDEGGSATPTSVSTSTNGQTPTGSATASPGNTPTVARPEPDSYEAERVWPDVNFERMVGLHFFPDDPSRALVLTQQEGVIRSFPTSSRSDVTTVLDLSDKLIDSPGNEEGLLGFAFAPDYPARHRIFVYYTAGNPRRSVIARYLIVNGVADPSSERVILEIPQPYPNHNGGALEFGPDGM